MSFANYLAVETGGRRAGRRGAITATAQVDTGGELAFPTTYVCVADVAHALLTHAVELVAPVEAAWILAVDSAVGSTSTTGSTGFGVQT